jgi:hypothetical protein
MQSNVQADIGNGNLSNGQRIYVPVYSHIYSGNKERPFLLTVTLSIRNIDVESQIKINTVDYYATQGELLKKYIDESIILKPLESIRFVVPQRDESGGSGANFIVEWKSDKTVNMPIIEAIMIGTQMQQGVSFVSRGREIFPSP